MSIVDAILKAKLMRKGRDPEPPRRIAPTLPPAAMQAKSVAREQPAAAAPLPVFERVEFKRVDYDLAECVANRIAVPGAEQQLMQVALPPYRMLRARVLQLCRTNNWSTLAITSPGPGEGKSVTALNLAISIAREGNYDVFLLDLDMRNPSIGRYLGILPPTDIIDFFNGKIPAKDVLFSVGIDRLVLGGGAAVTSNASELLATGRLVELLGFIRRSAPNPLVLIDLPPVVNTDDALVVAPNVDATVVVATEGKTRRDSLQRAMELLADYSVGGIILNRSLESIGTEYYGA